MSSLKGGYKSVATIIIRYWRVYGGLPALVTSPYFHASFVLLLLTSHTWYATPWWETVIAVLPNLLGFTLGGFAVFLSFGDDRFKSALAGSDPLDNSHSPLITVSTTFMHFVIVQIVALLWALVAKALHFDLSWPEIAKITTVIGLVGDLLGYWLFLYGICLAGASGVAIFRVAGWYDRFQTSNKGKSDSTQ